jgi:hypothetical protein
MALITGFSGLRWLDLSHRFLPVALCAAALFTSPHAEAWQGPFALANEGTVITDKPLIAVESHACHATGGFAFRVASDSKFKRVGKLRFKFLDANGNDVGSIASAYRLKPKSKELLAKYSPCLQASSFEVRHEPI